MSLRGKLASVRACVAGLMFGVACAVSPQPGASAQNAFASVDIAANKIGAAPSQFDLPEGQWTVVSDATATVGAAIEQSGVQRNDDRFPTAIYKPVSLKNAEVSLRIKAAGGSSNQGGGIAVRFRDLQNYYLVQLDALRNRVAFSRVSDGVPVEIVGVDADIASHTWHTLAVRSSDDQFVVSLDGTWVFTAFDKTLSQAGRVALWTEGDSITRFDSIAVTPLPTSEERY